MFHTRNWQITFASHGHLLTNAHVWSPDGQWIVYDIRSDPAGAVFDGNRIERVNARTAEVQCLYLSTQRACCGVATWSPVDSRVVFIHGPQSPTPDWQYSAFNRRGVIVNADRAYDVANLDARDLVPPFTAGALRGGSHVHTFSGDGQRISFTYEDAVLAELSSGTLDRDANLRCVGVSAAVSPVTVSRASPRNHDGSHFTVVVTRVTNDPTTGSDEIRTAVEDAWVGVKGYLRMDSSRQRSAIAFQGQVRTTSGPLISEVFIVDLPDDLTVPGDGPLEGTATRRPFPPLGCAQRRLTRTEGRKYPGIQGPRHWLRSSPDGSRIAFLMKDDSGIVQIWTVAPADGEVRQWTCNPWSVGSAFTWDPGGAAIAYVADNSVCVTDILGQTRRLTQRTSDADAPRPEACVFSPDGQWVAYVRNVKGAGGRFNQIFLVATPFIRSV